MTSALLFATLLLVTSDDARPDGDAPAPTASERPAPEARDETDNDGHQWAPSRAAIQVFAGTLGGLGALLCGGIATCALVSLPVLLLGVWLGNLYVAIFQVFLPVPVDMQARLIFLVAAYVYAIAFPFLVPFMLLPLPLWDALGWITGVGVASRSLPELGISAVTALGSAAATMLFFGISALSMGACIYTGIATGDPLFIGPRLRESTPPFLLTFNPARMCSASCTFCLIGIACSLPSTLLVRPLAYVAGSYLPGLIRKQIGAREKRATPAAAEQL